MDIQNLVLASFLLFGVSTVQKNTFTVADNQQHTLCRGSSFGISTVHSSAQLYEFYRAKYSNCTYVDGNLELVDLDQNYNLSFLRNIHEVTGYVLIKSVMSEFLWLENLRIIRGQLLLSQGGRKYSLYVEDNYNDEGIGLKELQLTSLHEIMYGDVYFRNNRLLCHEQTVQWRDILPPTSVVRFDDTLSKLRNCQQCDAKCTFDRTRRCWGSGPDQCQSITKLNCSEQCLFRCLPGAPHMCCHSECAGGCTGPLSSMCWACKNFANDRFCVNGCPPPISYDPITYKRYPNPDFKYSHGSICLRNCPKHMYSDESACIRECSNSTVVDGNCIPCAENCPTKCPGIKPPEYVHSGNIASFRGCNIIQNSVSILKETFTGDPTRNVLGLSESDLLVFETVTEITGYLQIEAEAVTHVNYFRNLTVIRGIETIPRSAFSLKIYGTQLDTLNFQSLKEIRSGSIIVENNPHLCYADDINWKKLFSLPEQMSSVSNRAKDSCAKDGHVCSFECSSDGCWGPRDDQCLSCARFRLGRRCIGSCDVIPRLYASSPAECQWCHEECKTKCSDNSSMTCDECRHFKDGQRCVASCPDNKYADDRGVCQPCHSNCDGGCTGGENTIGPGGCRSCKLVVLDLSDNVTGCVDVMSNCGDGFYKKTLYDHPAKELIGKQACKRCHPECRICNEFGLSLSSCESCLHYQQDDRCVRSCPSDYFVKNGTNVCLRCDSRCLHCSGPTASDCTVCKQYVVYHDAKDHGKGFNCTETCPDHLPHKTIEETESKEKVTVCVTEDPIFNAQAIGKIVGSVIGGVIVLSVVIIAIVAVLYKRAKTEANKVRRTAQLFGVPEAELLVPPVVNPDLAKLRLIKESELRRGAVIGSGAFGSVYRGMWIPENENVKLIVAIKVLNEGLSANQTLDLLNEVRIMASVNDQYCIRILAFCMTSQMMIVTQLMPHGCLLDFIRKHKTEIGSKVLLNWCTQIAKGMMYLEERSIVHRDLAARNILVQHPEHIRITDFGLSKLLDHNESEVHSTEEKVPIKWMALESIQDHCFTHKSDVWSYGVTLWELFTKGCVPYENICVSAIPDLLKKGERLAQPAICTIDVYMLMIKCWVIDYSSRPPFRYFAEEFAKMARDPGRYLVIEGDEFMRISSPIIGVKELMRYASIDSGGTEMIIAPDDYLRPGTQMRSARSQGQNDALEAVEEMASESDAASVSNNILNSSVSFPGENGHRSAIAQRLRRNMRSRGAAAANVTRQHSEPRGGHQSVRYCSDPCKAAILHQRLPVSDNTPPPPYSQADPTVAPRVVDVKSNPRDQVQGSAAPHPVLGRGTGVSRVQSQEVPLNLRFPVEQKPLLGQEDYLQPAGQHSTAYDDLLNSTSNENSPGLVTTSFISNPEYFEDIPSNAVGKVRTHRRSESEESAKYYNEFTPGAHNSSATHKGV